MRKFILKKKAKTNCEHRPNRNNKDHVQEYKNYPRQILRFKRERGKHPTQKPILLMEYLIKTYTNENETVLDFTMGSGSTGVAAKQTNRNFIGIEQDEKYFNVASERIKRDFVLIIYNGLAKKIVLMFFRWC